MRPLPAYLALAGRLVVGGSLVVSGFTKLMLPPEELAMAMEAYRLIPLSMAVPFARALPWVELFVGAFLALGFMMRFSVPGALALFGMFLAALSSALIRGLNIADCGCFGRSHLTPSQAILMDSVFLVLLAIVLFDKQHFFSFDRWLQPSKDRKAPHRHV
ncbi:MAG: DoxX family membrane protein [Elusimicrobia bacterium]|nr:DoxX family membrane protein [Elusimicrobiota bacterium]